MYKRLLNYLYLIFINIYKISCVELSLYRLISKNLMLKMGVRSV
jgi:hypothetical protein